MCLIAQLAGKQPTDRTSPSGRKPRRNPQVRP